LGTKLQVSPVDPRDTKGQRGHGSSHFFARRNIRAIKIGPREGIRTVRATAVAAASDVGAAPAETSSRSGAALAG
jgi:hypothetical protein